MCIRWILQSRTEDHHVQILDREPFTYELDLVPQLPNFQVTDAMNEIRRDARLALKPIDAGLSEKRDVRRQVRTSSTSEIFWLILDSPAPIPCLIVRIAVVSNR
uniref:Uncharacterized protein n=1 Tax=Rhodosorus marinus TaxID=101924 RepID=A0A7S3EJ09_9RHOD